MINKALSRTYAECWGLQLLVIDLPTMFENSIVHTQVQKQMVITRRFEQAATLIRAKTSVIAADFDRRIMVIKSGGMANYTFTTKRAMARARQRVIDQETMVLGSVRQSLKIHLRTWSSTSNIAP